MSAEKVKARKMYSTEVRTHCVILFGNRSSALAFHGRPTPFYVLPADADSIERMVTQMVLAMSKTDGTGVDLARAALAAIGVKAKGSK